MSSPIIQSPPPARATYSTAPLPTCTCPPPPPRTPKSPTVPAPVAQAIDKTLASTSNLLKLLPTATVLAYEALSPSFTNHGSCYRSNRLLTAVLVNACLFSCVFFAFTDTLVGRDGKHYYGLATFRGFYVFNFSGTDEHKEYALNADDLCRLKITVLDFVHAALAALVFAAVAASDSSLQNCFFPGADSDNRELLVNLPLGFGVLASLVFLVFPTTRRGIGSTDVAPQRPY